MLVRSETTMVRSPLTIVQLQLFLHKKRVSRSEKDEGNPRYHLNSCHHSRFGDAELPLHLSPVSGRKSAKAYCSLKFGLELRSPFTPCTHTGLQHHQFSLVLHRSYSSSSKLIVLLFFIIVCLLQFVNAIAV